MNEARAFESVGVIGQGPRAESLARAAKLHDAGVLTHSGEHDDGLAEFAGESNLVLLATDVSSMRALMRRLAPHLDGSHVVVHAVRGLEPETLLTASRLVVEETCVRKVGALLGPALADEWAQGGPNAAVVASRFPEAVQKTQAALAGAGLRVYGSKDLPGVELAGAASSLVAFALGVCRELKLGVTAESLLITRGIAEVSRLCVAQGGEAKSAFGLAGLGDVLVQREEESAAVRAGRAFAQGKGEAELSALAPEVVAAIASVRALAMRSKVTARLTSALYAVVHEGQGVPAAVEALVGLSHLPE